jgi:cytochrome c oxidase subunit 3
MNPRSTAATWQAHVGTAELGMWVFLASEVLFFGVLFFAYIVGRLHHSQAFAEASRYTDLTLGSVNTAVLLTSSLTMALAAREARGRRRRPCALLLTATSLLGLTFLALKSLEYYHDFDAHLVPGIRFSLSGSDPAGLEQFFWTYFVTTGAHAVHLLVGLGLVAVLTVRVAHGRGRMPSHAVEISGLYWHLVDIIWIFLFPLLYLVSRT